MSPFGRGGLLSLATVLLAGAPREVDPLASRQRRMLLELIRSRPGASVTEVMAHVPFQWGSMSYHLRRLTEAGLIHMVDDPTDGRRKRIYPLLDGIVQIADPPQRAPALRGLSRLIAQEVADDPGISFVDLCDRLDTSPRNIHYHLKRLHEHAFVTSGSVSRYRDLRPTPKLLQMLQPTAVEAMEGPEAAERADAGPEARPATH
jgi:DNA-binding transcriptional ArsR family regulator